MNVVLSVILFLILIAALSRGEDYKPGHLFAALATVVALWALWSADRLLALL